MLVEQSMLALLHTFEVSARHLSFTKAAEELFLTQGAISQRNSPSGGAAEIQIVYPVDP